MYSLEDHYEDKKWRKEHSNNRYKDIMTYFLTVLKNSPYYSNNSNFSNNFSVLLHILLKLFYKVSNNGYSYDVNNIII